MAALDYGRGVRGLLVVRIADAAFIEFLTVSQLFSDRAAISRCVTRRCSITRIARGR